MNKDEFDWLSGDGPDGDADAYNVLIDIRDAIAKCIYDAEGHDRTADHDELLWLVKATLPDLIGRVMPMQEHRTGDGDIPF